MSFGIGSEQRAPSKSHHIVRTTPSRRAALYYRPRLMPSKILTTASTEAGAPIAIPLSWARIECQHPSCNEFVDCEIWAFLGAGLLLFKQAGPDMVQSHLHWFNTIKRRAV